MVLKVVVVGLVVMILAGGCVVLLRVETWLEVLEEAVDSKFLVGSVVLWKETELSAVDPWVALLGMLIEETVVFGTSVV